MSNVNEGFFDRFRQSKGKEKDKEAKVEVEWNHPADDSEFHEYLLMAGHYGSAKHIMPVLHSALKTVRGSVGQNPLDDALRNLPGWEDKIQSYKQNWKRFDVTKRREKIWDLIWEARDYLQKKRDQRKANLNLEEHNMSKKGFEIIDHYRALKRVAIAKKLGVSTKLFESVEDLEENEELEEGEELEEMTTYGYDAKQEVGHDAAQGKQKPMQSIDEPTNKVGHRGPQVVKQGPNKHKETGMLEEEEELEEASTDVDRHRVNPYQRDPAANMSAMGGKHEKPRPRVGNYSIGKGKARKVSGGGIEETTEYGYDAKQEVGHEKRQGKQKPMQAIDTHANGAGSSDPGLRKKGGNKHKEDGMKESKLNEAVNNLLQTIHEFRKRKQ